MESVKGVADRYGVSTTFLRLALEQVGFKGAREETALSASTILRFDRAYGDGIAAARPDPATETTAPQPRSSSAKPHVLRVAYAHVAGRKADGHIETVMATESARGPAHVIDPVGTRDGDPWNGNPEPREGAHSFYDHPGPYAACESRLRVVMGEKFDPERPDACPTCARIATAGEAFRNPPGGGRYFCDAYLRLREEDGHVTVDECSLRHLHRGPHKTRDGATWDLGEQDYVPASD